MSVSGIRDRGAPNRAVGLTIAALAVAVGLLGAGIAVSPAVAGDAVAQFQFDESEHEADPGETVTLDVRASSDGGYADEGVESYSFVIAVPPEIGEPTAVEPGPWLAQGDGDVEQTVTDAGEGAIRVQHERVGVENGVTGDGVAATVTIELHEDAPASDAAVVVADAEANLYGSDYRMQTFGDDTSIEVGGGGAYLEPAYEPGSAGDDSVDVVTAAERNRSVDDGGEEGTEEENDDDPTPGFGVVGAAVGLLGIALWSRFARRQSD